MFKIDKKAFTAFQAQSMVFKVGREAIKVLQGELPGSELGPSCAGRPMKDWLRIHFERASLWPKLAQRAMVFVSLDKDWNNSINLILNNIQTNAS